MFILLLMLWIVLNGRITTEILCVGVVLVSGISHFMYKHLGYVPSAEGRFFRKLCWAVYFFGVLVVEVVKSGMMILQFVLAKEMDIQPQIVVFPVKLKSEFLKIILAHSITLTPGTITLNIEGDLFYVHAFDYTFGEDVVDSVFHRLLVKIEQDLAKSERGGDYF